MRTPQQEVAAFNDLTVQQIATRLGCSSDHVNRLIRSGKLPAIDISVGSRAAYRVAPKVFDEFLKSAAVPVDGAA